MEFVEYIKSPRIDQVSLRRRGRAYLEGTLCVTGHHLIFSSRTEHKDELIVSHCQTLVTTEIFMPKPLKLYLNSLDFGPWFSIELNLISVCYRKHITCFG